MPTFEQVHDVVNLHSPVKRAVEVPISLVLCPVGAVLAFQIARHDAALEVTFPVPPELVSVVVRVGAILADELGISGISVACSYDVD